MQGAGTDEQSLIEILSTRSNAEIAQIKMAYSMRASRDAFILAISFHFISVALLFFALFEHWPL